MEEKTKHTENTARTDESKSSFANSENNETKVELETLKENYKSLLDENVKLIEEREALGKTVARLQSSADKSDAYLSQLVALKSDFESYKRRMKFSAENSKNEGICFAAEKILPVMDTFDIAHKHITDAETLKAFEMIYAEFVKSIGELGVTEIEVEGKDFDHMTMNALSSLDRGEENKNKVVEIYKKGYAFGEKVLRYAEVIVGA